MATAKVSKRTVNGIDPPAQSQRRWQWDDHICGLGVVMTSTGRKSLDRAQVLRPAVSRQRKVINGKTAQDRHPRLALDT